MADYIGGRKTFQKSMQKPDEVFYGPIPAAYGILALSFRQTEKGINNNEQVLEAVV